MQDEIKNPNLEENLEENQTPQSEEQIQTTQSETQQTEETPQTQEPEIPIDEIDKKLDEEIIEENELTKLKEQIRNKISDYREHKSKVHTIRIDEKYISEQPPEIQKILRPIKGDILSERALKNYINAQLFIEKQKSKQQEQKIDYTAQPKTEITPTQTPIVPDENLDKALYLTMRVKYSDLPELNEYSQPDELIKEYLTDLQLSDPLKYYSFLKDYDLARQKINEQAQQILYIEQNWEQISAENIKKDIQKFENDLKEYGLTLQDLNLNLELDDKYYNEYLYNNILLKNGEANPEVVQRITDKALLFPEGAVYKKLIELNFKNILQASKNKSSGINLNKKVPPSMSTYHSTGNRVNKSSIPIDDIIEASPNEVDDEILNKYKEQLKSSIIGIK